MRVKKFRENVEVFYFLVVDNFDFPDKNWEVFDGKNVKKKKNRENASVFHFLVDTFEFPTKIERFFKREV